MCNEKEKQRAFNSIQRLKEFLRDNEMFLDEEIKKMVKDYLADAEYFFEKGDYFSSFGASDYAYGLIEGNIYCKRK